jgi:hypothetical protein
MGGAVKKTIFALLLVLAVAASSPVSALICTIDDVPAATLLLPYFEVDTANAAGQTTLFSINNASATAVLAHVVVWSDLSVPVLDFNVYLTGYDVQTINMRDIINGILPQTASDGQDPTDSISPQGDFSQDINFASCTGQLPPPAQLPADLRAYLQAALTGQGSTFSTGVTRCYGQNLGDNVARGYVTVDTVNNCTLRFPGDPGYFGAGGTGDATNQNVLWGDYFYVNTAENFAQGETLVHIEASATDPETSVGGEYTFYGRYVAWSAADNREPLATNFAFRYAVGNFAPGIAGDTNIACWRDSKVAQLPFACPAAPGVRPTWYPLNQEGVVIFDEQEQPAIPTGVPVSPPPTTVENLLCPAEAQRTVIGGAEFPVPFDFGWIYANLNQSNAAVTEPSEDPLASQAWVTDIMDASGRFSVGFDAIQLDSACNAVHFLPGS